MSKRVKRWKLQDRNTQSDSAVTISDHGEAPPQLVYMEGQDRQSWVHFISEATNSEVLRMTSERIERPKEHHYGMAYNIQHMIYFDSPLVIWVAVQATLAMKHDSKFDICGRLVMLATMQSLIYTTTAVKNTILMQLCEILIATILLGSPNHASALVALERRVHRYNKNYEVSSIHIFYRSNAVSKVLSRCPQLLGRVIRFLKAIELDHEIEVITAEVCQEDKALSPSDHVWLDWCRPRIEHPERYGKKTEVLSQCANVLFRFLDYGSNCNSTRAWLMLDRAFTFVDTAQMSAIWAERYDWWPQFHVVHLPPEAELRRSELLAALGKVPIE
uniref:Zn(II)2Cys6 transcription factor n=1 Tax=Angiostrongylus cantonensis TaxID=6313 RepID=A0A0K0CXU8_ANGCA